MTLKTQIGGAVVLLAFICAAWAEPASADLEAARAHLSKGEYAESIKLLKPLVEAGDLAAMNAMGFHLDNGYGVAKDSRAAAEYYRKAAEKGNAVAQFNLAGGRFFALMSFPNFGRTVVACPRTGERGPECRRSISW